MEEEASQKKNEQNNTNPINLPQNVEQELQELPNFDTMLIKTQTENGETDQKILTIVLQMSR